MSGCLTAPAARRSGDSGYIPFVLAALFTAHAVPATAADFPTKPVRIIVPTSSGGGTDMVARALAQRLTDSWGQQVVVDNRPGAGGTIGAETAARALPDGYTLMVSTNAVLTINPHLYAKLGYDPMKSFSPVTQAASSPFVLVVHPSLPVRTVRELIANARAHPGTLNYSSSGNGSATHLAGAMFNVMAGTDILHIPYKGSGPAITDLLAGQIQLRFSAVPPILQFVRTGKLRALGVTGAKRFALLPELPTVAESVPGYQSDIWYGVLMPAGTPSALVTRIHADIVRQLNAPEVREKLAADGSEVIGNSPKEFADLIRTELARWARTVRETGARMD